MNHLSGLQHAVFDLSALSSDEAESLSAFRAAYEALRPSSLDPSPAIDTPTFVVSTSSLPPSGWRSLDDCTLYRFLCADRRQGEFQPETSLLRLKNAMAYRRLEKADEVLASIVEGEENKFEETHDKTHLSPKAAMTNSTVKWNGGSPRSLASGSLEESEDGSLAVVGFEATRATESSRVNVSKYQQDLERYQKLRVRIFVGQAHDGLPVMFERVGEFLGSGNVNHFSIEEWCRFYIWDMERHFPEMRNASEATGKAIDKYVFFGDVAGLVSAIINQSIWKVIPLLKALVANVENHYPEIVKFIVLFNVPRIATVFYKAVKVFLDPVTASKIELHPGVPLSRFKELIPESVIPITYGGSNPVPYPKTETS